MSAKNYQTNHGKHSNIQRMDITSLRAVLTNLRTKIIPSRLEKVQQLDAYTLQIAFRTLEKLVWVEISWHADSARIIQIYPPEKIKGESTLSKQIKFGSRGMALVELKQEGFDRIAEFGLGFRPNENIQKSLVIEIMGRHSNLLFLNDKRQVITLGKQVRENQSRFRPIGTGDKYVSPPPLQGIEPNRGQSFEDWKSELSIIPIPLKQALCNTFQGISPALLIQLAGEREDESKPILNLHVDQLSDEKWRNLFSRWTKWVKDLEEENFCLCFRGPTPYRVWKINNLNSSSNIDISLEIGNYYKKQLEKNKFNQILNQISIESKKKKESEKDLLERQELLFKNSLDTNSLKVKADNILSSNYPSKEKIKEAQNLYLKVKKLQRSKKILQERIHFHKQKINFLNETDLYIDYILNNEDEDIKEKLKNIFSLKEDLDIFLISRTQNKTKKPKPLRRNPIKGILELRSPSGLIIQIGRNHRQNELISIKKSRKGDLWFHVQECPGSHVVIKSSNRLPQESDLKLGADLAAFFSKARQNNKVSVLMVPTHKLQKLKGTAPGIVSPRESQVVWGDPFNGQKYLEESTKNA